MYYPSPVELKDSSITLPMNNQECIRQSVIDVRGAMAGIGERPGLAPYYWGVDLFTGTDILHLTLRHGNSSFGDILDRRQSLLSLRCGNDLIFEKDVKSFESSSDVYNTLRMTIDKKNSTLSISGGGKKTEFIADYPLMEDLCVDSVAIWSRGTLTISSLSIETLFSPQDFYATDWTEQTLREHLLHSDDPVEGFWKYLDRENDPLFARPGGRYLLAMVKNTVDEGYDIIYVSGAETRREQWHPMMRKGKLKPTIFVDHYDLEWVDSTFDTIDRDIHASVSEGAILTLSFPLLKTVMRFSRVPKDFLSQEKKDR